MAGTETTYLAVRLRPEHRRQLAAAAELTGMTLSTWIRASALAAARQLVTRSPSFMPAEQPQEPAPPVRV